MSPQPSFIAPPHSQLVPNTTSRFFIGSQELRVFHLAPREVTQSNKYQEERSPSQVKGRVPDWFYAPCSHSNTMNFKNQGQLFQSSVSPSILFLIAQCLYFI